MPYGKLEVSKGVGGGPFVGCEAGTVTLHDNEQWWRAFANALPAAIYMTDPSGRITFYNDAAAAAVRLVRADNRHTAGADAWAAAAARGDHPAGARVVITGR